MKRLLSSAQSVQTNAAGSSTSSDAPGSIQPSAKRHNTQSNASASHLQSIIAAPSNVPASQPPQKPQTLACGVPIFDPIPTTVKGEKSVGTSRNVTGTIKGITGMVKDIKGEGKSMELDGNRGTNINKGILRKSKQEEMVADKPDDNSPFPVPFDPTTPPKAMVAASTTKPLMGKYL